jgi:hypothetical protein
MLSNVIQLMHTQLDQLDGAKTDLQTARFFELKLVVQINTIFKSMVTGACGCHLHGNLVLLIFREKLSKLICIATV